MYKNKLELWLPVAGLKKYQTVKRGVFGVKVWGI